MISVEEGNATTQVVGETSKLIGDDHHGQNTAGNRRRWSQWWSQCDSSIVIGTFWILIVLSTLVWLFVLNDGRREGRAQVHHPWRQDAPEPTLTTDGSDGHLFISDILPPPGTYKDTYTKMTRSKDILDITTDVAVVSERTVSGTSVEIITTRKIGKRVQKFAGGGESTTFCDTDKGGPYAIGFPHLICANSVGNKYLYRMAKDGSLDSVRSPPFVPSFHEEPTRMLKFLPRHNVSVDETWQTTIADMQIGLFTVEYEGISEFRGHGGNTDHRYAVIESLGSFRTRENDEATFGPITMKLADSSSLTAKLHWSEDQNIITWAHMMVSEATALTDSKGKTSTVSPAVQEYVFVTQKSN